jgi:hypothetical protein
MLIIKCSVCKYDVDIDDTIESKCKVHYEGYFN